MFSLVRALPDVRYMPYSYPTSDSLVKEFLFCKKLFYIDYINNNVHQIIKGSAHFGIKNMFLDGILTKIGYLPAVHLTHKTYQYQRTKYCRLQPGWLWYQKKMN